MLSQTSGARHHPARDALVRAGFQGLSRSAPALGRLRPLRRLAVGAFEQHALNLHRRALASGWLPAGVQADRLAVRLALLHMADRALAEGRVGRNTLRALLGILMGDILVRRGDESAKDRFRAANGCGPPDMLVLSPGKACNLSCVGCYANAGPAREKLDWDTLDRLVTEAHDLWGTRFFTLSGGEPLVWRDGRRGVLDLAHKHRDCFFMSYTNGTLIDDRVAERIGELGNFTPALSVEGLRERTDARRGDGVFDRVLAAMRRLGRQGVMFGLSLTATRENCEELLSDELIRLFFEEMGVLYAWIFHYMPIGRAQTLDLMPTVDQRLALGKRMWELVRERHLFIADFWNSGTVTNGCIAGGRPGGYLYVDWNGAVCPCVFIPYSPVNIKEAYRQGKTLNDVWREPFFQGIRAWQRGYGYREPGQTAPAQGNWLRPCLIRDHHAVFDRLAREHAAQPADEAARAAQRDPSYREGLEAFGRELAAATDPIWARQYLGPEMSTRTPGQPPPSPDPVSAAQR